MSALDTQIGGSHYKDMKIQPMEFSMANNLDACQHTIIKYVTRFRSKGGVQDLEKAKHVIDMLIQFEDEAEEPKAPATPTGEADELNRLQRKMLDAIFVAGEQPKMPKKPEVKKECNCIGCQLTRAIRGNP